MGTFSWDVSIVYACVIIDVLIKLRMSNSATLESRRSWGGCTACLVNASRSLPSATRHAVFCRFYIDSDTLKRGTYRSRLPVHEPNQKFWLKFWLTFAWP